MRKSPRFKPLILFLFVSVTAFCQTTVTFCTWNIENIGKSKSDREIKYIANILKNMDVVTIQEVVAGYGGTQAIAKLADELNRTGNKWDYTISDVTSGDPYQSERYAFLWKTKHLTKMGDAWLEEKYAAEIAREPYLCTFRVDKKEVTLGSFHATTKSKHPAKEISCFQLIPMEYPNRRFLFAGDWNTPEKDPSFDGLKQKGYLPVLQHQKTSLKRECAGQDCLASEYDNVFCRREKIQVIKSGVVHFYKDFSSLDEARKISDHIPVFVVFTLK